MKRLFTLLFTILCLSGFSTEPKSLQGSVKDQKTGESLAGAKVIVKGTDVVTYTDFDGNFDLKGLAKGTYEIEISLVGYQDENTLEVEVSESWAKLSDFQLQSK